MLSVTSNAYISTNVPSTDTGIAMPVIRVARASRRNAYSTRIASRPPSSAADLTSLIAAEMNFDWSYTGRISVPSGNDFDNVSIRLSTPAASATVFASPSL